MCVIFIAHRAHRNYPLVVAANRDELHVRPTAPAGWWRDAPEVLAGRDLLAGGTWMGVTRTGRFAAITNFHGVAHQQEPPRSRGDLVRAFLLGNDAPVSFTRAIEPSDYNGFSLFVADLEELAFFSNHERSERRLGPGLYGLANGSLDSDEPRVTGLKTQMAALLESRRIDPVALLDGLASSPLFIVHPLHGTRSSTVLLIDSAGNASFDERSFNAQGHAAGGVAERFVVRGR